MPDADPLAAVAHTAQQQATPMQELFTSFNYDVQTEPDGTRMLILESMLPRKVMVFPFAQALNAEDLGRKLIGPGVVVPSQNGHRG